MRVTLIIGDRPVRRLGDILPAIRDYGLRRGCTRKIKYPARESAERGAESMFRRYGAELEPYRCRYCDGWHIGHAR